VALKSILKRVGGVVEIGRVEKNQACGG